MKNKIHIFLNDAEIFIENAVRNLGRDCIGACRSLIHACTGILERIEDLEDRVKRLEIKNK